MPSKQVTITISFAVGLSIGFLEELPFEVTTEVRIKLEKLMNDYKDVFSLHELDLGRSTVVKHSINTGSHKPIRQPLRRQPPSYQEAIDKQTDTLLKQGVIVPATSPWAFNVVLVKKKEGS